jgi:hypothetical protein
MCVVLVGCSSVNSASAFSFDIFSFHSPASNPATAAADDHGFDAFQLEPVAPVPYVVPKPFGNFTRPSAKAQPQRFGAFGGH